MEPWVCGQNAGLLVDQYELTMLDAYLREGMTAAATFSLFVRKLPSQRNYLLACGLEQVLEQVELLRFGSEALERATAVCRLSPAALAWLRDFHFSGDIWAVPEGTPVFDNEPLLEVTAPLPEAQLLETIVMNQLHVQTLLASKASRVVTAAAGRDVVEFGLRRAQGADAGLKAARAAYVAGAAATSNVLAGALYGIPVSGTMAHSYVQAHDSELDAFRAWCRTHPGSTLLVDTYDTLEGVRHVITLAKELGGGLRLRAVRLDSGDLLELSHQARAMLDAAGLNAISIFASGGLDEGTIAALVEQCAPIDGFGVGTAMTVSTDAPSLDLAYKLVEYAGKPRLKLSPKKLLLPGRKQVFRSEQADADVIARFEETLPGEPLLAQVMRAGQRVAARSTLDEVRHHAAAAVARLPPRVRGLDPAEPPFTVRVSAALEALLAKTRADVRK
jgi:nicotinate phosphoribosyltransferase